MGRIHRVGPRSHGRGQVQEEITQPANLLADEAPGRVQIHEGPCPPFGLHFHEVGLGTGFPRLVTLHVARGSQGVCEKHLVSLLQGEPVVVLGVVASFAEMT